MSAAEDFILSNSILRLAVHLEEQRQKVRKSVWTGHKFTGIWMRGTESEQAKGKKKKKVSGVNLFLHFHITTGSKPRCTEPCSAQYADLKFYMSQKLDCIRVAGHSAILRCPSEEDKAKSVRGVQWVAVRVSAFRENNWTQTLVRLGLIVYSMGNALKEEENPQKKGDEMMEMRNSSDAVAYK